MIEIDHVCQDQDCPHIGQRTFPGCKCHKTREQMLEAEVIRLRQRLTDPAQGAWQPIETAPKDGSHILAYRLPVGIRFTNNTNPPTVVHWFDDPEQPGFYTSVNERAPEYPFNPTHWKPLDPPPTLPRPERGTP